MRHIRIYQAIDLQTGTSIQLDPRATTHVARVLRCKLGSVLTLFNGKGGEYSAEITAIDKRSATLKIGEYSPQEVESHINIHLAQVLSRGERMDFVVQKAVELGVNQITPLLSEHCQVKLPEERMLKRMQHWQQTIISACEQSGRNTLPILNPLLHLSDWIQQTNNDICFIFDKSGSESLKDQAVTAKSLSVLIGAEGGFSDYELAFAKRHHFIPISLGPRILRTETATLCAMSLLQFHFGDMA